MLTKDERKKLNSLLPFGSHSEIAKIVGVSRTSMAMWFNGRNNSDRIEDAVLDYYRIYKENKEAKLSGLF
jgi:hypothetical protein